MSTINPFYANGEKPYLCKYTYKGEQWSFEIKAKSRKEAEERLKQISCGQVLGEVEAVIPYELGWMAKSWVWISDLKRHFRL